MADLNEVGQPKYLTRSNLPAVHWDSFFDAVNEAFKLNIASAGPAGQRAPVFVTDYPKTNQGSFETSFDVIVFHILGSKMAPQGNHGQRVPKGATYREVKPQPNKQGYSLVTMAWWEMMSVQFTIYGLSHKRADELTEWFQLMLFAYNNPALNFFRERGINYMHFEGRGADELSREYGQELYKRTLKWDVRLELLQHFSVKNLETLTIEIPETATFTVSEQYAIPKP